MKLKSTLAVLASLVGAASLFAHSKAIQPEFVDMVLQPYFQIQKALASDDLPAAKKSAGTFATMLKHGPTFEEAPSLADLSDEAKKIVAAADIKVARASFQVISHDLAKMVEHIGTTSKSDVYAMRCPMAFGGKGGEWLQSTNDLKNPYYGTKMLTCGAVQSQLATQAKAGMRMDGDDHGMKMGEEDAHSH